VTCPSCLRTFPVPAPLPVGAHTAECTSPVVSISPTSSAPPRGLWLGWQSLGLADALADVLVLLVTNSGCSHSVLPARASPELLRN
jgi:hypothetical protein